MDPQSPALTAIPILVFLFMMAIAIVLVGFWIWMLIDCIQHEPSEGNDKLVWVLVLLFTNWLGALIYYFVRRRERLRRGALTNAGPTELH